MKTERKKESVGDTEDLPGAAFLTVGVRIELTTIPRYPHCQGHSHPKLLVALDEGSKMSADEIQPTAHRPTGYGQYSGVVPWPLNNDGQCYVKLRSV